MILSLALIVAGIGQAQPGSQIPGTALSQNQVSFFSDFAIIEVVDEKKVRQSRSLRASPGSTKVEVLTQAVKVVQASFKNNGELALVLPPKMSQFGAPRLGYLERSEDGFLSAGRYFVHGKLSTGHELPMTPDVMSLGIENKDENPPIRLVYLESYENEIGVFSCFPTSSKALETADPNPSAMLVSLLAAGLSDKENLTGVTEFLLRINHLAFAAWKETALPLQKFAEIHGLAAPAFQKSLLLAVAFKCGATEQEGTLFNALIQADVTEPGVWDRPGPSGVLLALGSGSQPRSLAYDAWLRNKDRQVLIASLLGDSMSSSVRNLLLARATSNYDPAMRTGLLRLLLKVDPSRPEFSRLLGRLSEWLSEPDHGPVKRIAGESEAEFRMRGQSELEFWRHRLDHSNP